MDIKKPGYETTKELWDINSKNLKKFADKHIIPFLNKCGIKQNDLCYDVGEYNPRIDYIAQEMRLKIKTIDSNDFNFHRFKKHDIKTIFAFEIFEHIQNPLFFLKEMKKSLSENGSIFLIIPCNPYCLWHTMHFFEMNKKHFVKWILNPLDLKIVNYKKIYFIASWRIYLIGFRPLIKLFTGKTALREFIRSFFYFQYGIYEVKNVTKN